MTHETDLHHRDDIRIGSKNWFQGRDVLKHELNGRVRVGLIWIGGGAGPGVVDKADDQFEAFASGSVEYSCNVI